MKKFFNNKKVGNIFAWIIAIGLVFGIPYLFIGILQAGLAFKPLGYLIGGLMYLIVGGVVVTGLIQTGQYIYNEFNTTYLREGRTAGNKKLFKAIKATSFIAGVVILMLGIAPPTFESFLGYLVFIGFICYYILPAIRDLWKGFRKNRKK